MNRDLTPEVALDWRAVAEELGFNQDKIEAHLGRLLNETEIEQLEDMDNAHAVLMTEGPSSSDAFEFIEAHGHRFFRTCETILGA